MKTKRVDFNSSITFTREELCAYSGEYESVTYNVQAYVTPYVPARYGSYDTCHPEEGCEVENMKIMLHETEFKPEWFSEKEIDEMCEALVEAADFGY